MGEGFEQKAFWIVLGAVAILAIGGFFALGAGDGAKAGKQAAKELAAQNPSSSAQQVQSAPALAAQEPKPAGEQWAAQQPSAAPVQDVYIRALSTGTYDKEQVAVKKGMPVRLHFSADLNAGCGKILLMRDFGVKLISRSGEEQLAEFTPQQEGTYEYSCSMRMFRGAMQVV